MKGWIIFTLIVLAIIPIIFASCEKGQLDINDATKEELDNLSGIGLVKAEEIINSRPFKSVEELINVKGIGEATLSKIKEQGLACVDLEKNIENEEHSNQVEEIENSLELNLVEKETNKSKKIEAGVIKLNTKNIKTKNNTKNLDKTNYAKYGFVILCTLLGFLLILKKRKPKTEFN